MDHNTLAACYGPEALILFERFKPEVVLLDIGLPGMDGYELAQRLRADPLGSSVLLIAVTGWGSNNDKDRSQEAGFDFHLTKPVKVAELISLMAEQI